MNLLLFFLFAVVIMSMWAVRRDRPSRRLALLGFCVFVAALTYTGRFI